MEREPAASPDSLRVSPWGAAPGQGVRVSSQPTPHLRATEHAPGAGGGRSAALAERGPLATPWHPQLCPLPPLPWAAGESRRWHPGLGAKATLGLASTSRQDYQRPWEALAHENRKRWEKALHLPPIVIVWLFFARRHHPAASPTLRSAKVRPEEAGGGPGLGPFCRAQAKPQAASAQKDLDFNLVFQGEPRGLSEATGPGESWHCRGNGPFRTLPTESGRGSRGTQRSHPIRTLVTLGE